MAWRACCPTSKPKSSGAPIMRKDLPSSPNAGSSSAPLRGLIVAAGSRRIGRTSIAGASHSFASLQSASCSENSAIRLDLSGQTLRQGAYSITRFHWEIEFPEVYNRDKGRFDAVVENPPFARVTSLAMGTSGRYTSFLRTTIEE